MTTQIQTLFIEKIREILIHGMLTIFQLRMTTFLSPMLTVKDYTSYGATLVMWLQNVSPLTSEEKDKKKVRAARKEERN